MNSVHKSRFSSEVCTVWVCALKAFSVCFPESSDFEHYVTENNDVLLANKQRFQHALAKQRKIICYYLTKTLEKTSTLSANACTVVSEALLSSNLCDVWCGMTHCTALSTDVCQQPCCRAKWLISHNRSSALTALPRRLHLFDRHSPLTIHLYEPEEVKGGNQWDRLYIHTIAHSLTVTSQEADWTGLWH